MGHILIVEDDTGIREAVVDVLSDTLCSISSVENGVAAKRLLAAGGVDLVVLDLMMPGCSGWELLGWMRAQAALASTPVIVASALDAPPDRLGAQAYLRKPYGSQVLLRTIERLLQQRSHVQERPPESAHANAHVPVRAPAERAHGGGRPGHPRRVRRHAGV